MPLQYKYIASTKYFQGQGKGRLNSKLFWSLNENFEIFLYVFHVFIRFEISEHIPRNQNLIIGLDSYSRQRLIYLDPILTNISL